MREIKFRAWDDREKKMYIVTSLLWKQDGLWACCDNQHARLKQLMLNTQYKPLMQFTGLHDKNGKEIWEGDIVKNSNAYGKIGEVKWNKHYWDACGTGLIISDDEEFGVEVLGNIYENPQLLESAQDIKKVENASK
jgi:uncharacterized phage protein (TIGR01671 family)